MKTQTTIFLHNFDIILYLDYADPMTVTTVGTGSEEFEDTKHLNKSNKMNTTELIQIKATK